MFNFNGINFKNIIKVTRITRPIIAPQSLSVTSIEGRTGSKFHRKTSSSYTISIDFYLKETTNLRTQLRNLAYLLDTDKPAKLVFDDEPDKYIMAILSDSTEFEEVFKNGTGTINFFCVDPYWYAVNDDIFTTTSSSEYSFVRQGTSISYPTYEIQGSGSGGYSITTNGIKMTISYSSISSSDKIIIDSEKLTAYLLKSNGTKQSMIMHLDNLEFPILYQGQNKVTIKGIGSTVLKSYKIKCNSRWK